MSNITSSTPLLTFKGSRRMHIGAFVNKESGESFKSCIFTDEQGNKCFVAFSSKLGELSAAQIKEMKDELQVVTMDSGRHILCKQGDNAWEEVDL